MSSRWPLTVLHVRDTDGECSIQLYDADGDVIGDVIGDDEFGIIDVDAGRGYDVNDWQENIDWARRTLPPNSPLSRATLAAYADPPGRDHISGFDELGRP